jgi:hypothetical protein
MKNSKLFPFVIWLSVVGVFKAYTQTWQPLGPRDSNQASGDYAMNNSIAIDGSGTPYVAYWDYGNGSKATVKKFTGGNWVTVGSAGFSAGIVGNTSIAIDGSGYPYVVYADFANGQNATVMKFNGSSWVTVGSAGFSASNAFYTSIAINSSGIPYVVYSDGGNSQKATVMKFNGSSWVLVGSAGFSAGQADYTSIAMDASGNPYVAFQDYGNSNKATVMKFNGSSWVTMGSAGFSTGQADYTAMAIDGSGNPYVVYQDYGNSNKATVMKFNGSSWVTIGSTGFSAGQADYTSITIDGSGTPYVAYHDNGNSNKATVMKFNGSSWVTVGSAGFSVARADWTSIAMNASGVPYVIYQDYGDGSKATVMKFNGSTWIRVGITGFSADLANYTSIGLNSSGTPYVVYRDYGHSSKATVMKFSGSSWVTVGSTGFSAGQADWSRIAIDASGTPYVVYKDYGNSSNATVMKFNGSSWVTVGSAGFSAGQVDYTFIAIDGGGTPYVVYRDAGNGYKATVMKFNGSSWVTVGNAGFSAGQVGFISIAIDGSGTPFVAYDDGANSDKVSVMKFNGTSWVGVGSVAFSAGTAGSPIIAIDAIGTPYVSFQDGANSSKATVMKFNGTSWVIVGSAGFSAGNANPPCIALDATGTPYVVYRDEANNRKATVMKFNGSNWVIVGSVGFSSGKVSGTALAIDGSGTAYVVFSTGGAWGYKYVPPTAITTNAISSLNYCAGVSISVPFSAVGTFTGGNVFTAQLSDASGSFGTPVNIGALTSVVSGTISAAIPSNAPAGTGYRIRVVSSNPVVSGTDNGSNLSIQSGPCFTWTGALSTVWSASGNWSGGVAPTAVDDVLIPTGLSNYPYLTGNLTHNASITIESGASLKIDGILTNNGTITINSGGSLLQTNGSTLASGGTYNVKRAISALSCFISSPINNEPVSGFGISPTGANGGQIVPNTSNPCNPNNIDASSPYGNLLELRENPTVLNNCAQSLWFVKSAGTLTNGRGYSLRNGTTLNFSGTVNNGTVTFSGLTRQNGNILDGDGSNPTRGWHLVGNPYPSPITLNTGDLGVGFDNQIALFNNGTWITNSLAVSPITIAVGQGFQIRKTAVGGTSDLTFTNSLRTAGNPTFFGKTSVMEHFMHVSLNNGSFTDNTTIYFVDDATDGFDPMYDANRMSDDIDFPMVYTIASGERLSYNALPPMNAGESKSVGMGVRTEVYGDHTLGFSDLVTLNGATVMLEDLKLNTMQPVSEGYIYNFTTVAGDARERFVLHFNAGLALGIKTIDKSGIPVYSFCNRVYINTKDIAAEEKVTATAYDIAGGQLFNEQIKGGSLFAKPVETIGTNLIIVQLTNGKGETFRTKLFLSQEE